MQADHALPSALAPDLHHCCAPKSFPTLNRAKKSVQSARLQHQGWNFAHSMAGLHLWATAVRNYTEALIRSIRRLVGEGECKLSLLFPIYCIRCVADVVCGRANYMQTCVLNNLASVGFIGFGPPLLGRGGDIFKGVWSLGLNETYVVQEVVWVPAVFVQ